MPDWVVCPGCGLRHTSRPDGRCPRCTAETEGDAAASEVPVRAPAPERATPAQPLAQTVSDASDESAPFGARLAGGVLVLNALALLAESTLGVGDQPAGLGASPVRVLVGLAMGAAILGGSMKAVQVARVLVALGAVGLTAVLLFQGQHLLAGLQFAFSTALLLLLLGTAGRFRIAVALAMCAAYFTVEGVGLYGLETGRHPLGRLMMAADLEPGPVESVTGAAVPYRLAVPPGSWYLRTAAAAQRENPLADRWLVRPDRDAHVLVIAETLSPGAVVEMARFREVVIGNMEQGQPTFVVTSEGPLPTALEAGHLVEGRSVIEGQPLEWRIALYVQSPHIIQVLGFGNGKSFPEVETEIQAIVGSLTF